MSSGYFNQFGVDLDGWFGPLGFAPATHKVGYQVAGVDFNLRYWPLSNGGIPVPPTGFYWQGQDLNTIFGWPPITAVGLEVHLVQIQTLDGGTVVSYDNAGTAIENKYYASSGIGTIYGDPIPIGAVVHPSLPIVGLGGANDPSTPKTIQTNSALSFRIRNADGSYQSLLSKYPTASITVTAQTAAAVLTVIGDLPNAYTVAAMGVTPTETNSSVSFKVEIPPAIPGNPSMLLYFGTVQVKPPKGIAQLFFPTGLTPTIGAGVLTANGTQTVAGGLTYTTSVQWQTDTNVTDLAINASFSSRVASPITPSNPTLTQIVAYPLDITWGIDPTNLFSEETVTIQRLDGSLTAVYDWFHTGYSINAYSRGAFNGTSPTYTWNAGTTTDDVTLTGVVPSSDPSIFLTAKVLICQSRLAADGNKLDILGDYYIVDTSAMDKFAFSDSGTLQYTGS